MGLIGTSIGNWYTVYESQVLVSPYMIGGVRSGTINLSESVYKKESCTVCVTVTYQSTKYQLTN